MRRVLITGGAGFIGRRVTRILAARQVQVAVVDNLLVPVPMPSAGPYVTPYHADIRDPIALHRIFTEFLPHAVLHLAALHHIPSCERDPARAADINITGTQILLDAAAPFPLQHFILASSAAVYAWEATCLQEERTPLAATDVYSLCKLTNESQVRLWAERTGCPAILARIFNVIGHDDPNAHLIPDILQQISPDAGQHGAVIRLGNTKPKRDYTHADDTAAGLVALLDHPPSPARTEAYNISYGQEYSVQDLVEAMAGILEVPLTIAQDTTRIRKIDRPHLLGDGSKMLAATGWQAQIPFHDAIRRILKELRPDMTHMPIGA